MKTSNYLVIFLFFLAISAGVAFSAEYRLFIESYPPANLTQKSKIIDIPDPNDQVNIAYQAGLFAFSPEGWNLDNGLPNTIIEIKEPPTHTGHLILLSIESSTPVPDEFIENFGYELNQEAIDYGYSCYYLYFHTDEWSSRLSHDYCETANNYGVIVGGMGGYWAQCVNPNWGRFWIEECEECVEQPAPLHPVPETGQTKCYDNAGEIPCPAPGEPFYGQDSSYEINPRSYTKLDQNGNELPDDAPLWSMVRDNVTGLVWEMKTDDGSIHDEDNGYSWINAQNVFITNLNNTVFGGHNDWRLPNLTELHSIADDSKLFPKIDTELFFKTGSFGGSEDWMPFWSAYPYWALYFRGGQSHGPLTNDSQIHGPGAGLAYVIAVRGDPLVNSFVDNGNGTVTDWTTNLTWEKKTNDGGNNDKDNLYTWESSLSWISNLNNQLPPAEPVV